MSLDLILPSKTLLSVNDLIESKLFRNVDAIRRCVEQGLPVLKINPRNPLFIRSEILEWIETRRSTNKIQNV